MRFRKIRVIWKVRDTPSIEISYGIFAVISFPSNRTRPPLGRYIPLITLNIVDFPEPLGPIRLTTLFLGTSNVTSLSAE